MKAAILFAGQGSQVVGMGKDLYDNYEIARKYFDQAEEVLNAPLKQICFEGPEEELKKTENTQPAIFTMSFICYQLLLAAGFKGEAHVGFSLGEYTALCAGNYFDFATGVKLVRERGLIMDNAIVGIDGGMAAILGLEDDIVETICAETAGVVVPVNYNCPRQLVISGEKKAVELACQKAEEKGASRTVILNVSGPFHSPLLKPGSEKLKDYLDKVAFNENQLVKVVANVTADYYPDNSIKELLVKQMYSPVQWRKSMDLLIRDGFDTFIEVGPGKTLRGFLRSIDRKQKAFNINNAESLEITIGELAN